MSKTLMLLVMIIFFLSFYSGVCEAQNTISLNELVENGKSFDGKTVVFQGEALGEALERGAYSWVNVSDSTNVMGIWMKYDDAKKIGMFGDYKHKGDILKISGVFHRACKEHGGDMDIHSMTVDVVEHGHQIKEKVSSQKILAGIVLTMIAFMIVAIYLKYLRKPSGI